MHNRLKIAVDARNLFRPLTGIERVICTTVDVLAHQGAEVHLCLPAALHKDYAALAALPNVSVHVDPMPTAAGRVVWGRTLLSKRIKQLKPDVVWAPAHRLSASVAKLAPSVLTIHDMVWDKAPETMLWYRRIGDRILSIKAVANACCVVCVSRTTAQDLRQICPDEAAKICVVPNIVADLNTVQAATKIKGLDLSQAFLLCVGGIKPRKNMLRTLQAFQALPAQLRHNTKLVVAGQNKPLSQHVRALVEGSNGSIVLLGRVDENQLASLYQHCKGIVMMSVYEGFGYPVVEAQHFGKPVITSQQTSMVEIAGPTAILANPHDVESIAHAMVTVLSNDQEQDFIEKTKANANIYSSQTIAPLIAKIFTSCAANGKYIP